MKIAMRFWVVLLGLSFLGCGEPPGGMPLSDEPPRSVNGYAPTGEASNLGMNLAEELEALAPHTGHTVFEQETAPKPFLRFFEKITGMKYVYTNRLNVRSRPEISEDNLLGALSLNDQVNVIDVVSGTAFVRIEIIKTNEVITPAEAYYVSKDYLSEKPNQQPEHQSRGRFFMIQNVATEIIRIYEKMCNDGQCAHKMVLETEAVVGEKTKNRSTMTVLGSFNITKWYKFYQDGAGTYPSWYDPNYPAMPDPGSGVMAWTSRSVLPYKGAKVRGAFGWYTAHVGPDSHAQWTHGTIGWGEDKDKFIKATRGFWANLFSDPRSHGCTRTDNESIAFIRHLLDVGAPLLKVYAIEALGDPNRSRYSQAKPAWAYVLTKNGVRADGERADREEVLQRGTPRPQWLEEGTYAVDMYPDAEGFQSGSRNAKSGKNGNVYGLDKSEMRGVFLIDEGRLVSYTHPASLGVGGYGRHSFPGFVVARDNPSYVIPKPEKKNRWDDDENYN